MERKDVGKRINARGGRRRADTNIIGGSIAPNETVLHFQPQDDELEEGLAYVSAESDNSRLIAFVALGLTIFVAAAVLILYLQLYGVIGGFENNSFYVSSAGHYRSSNPTNSWGIRLKDDTVASPKTSIPSNDYDIHIYEFSLLDDLQDTTFIRYPLQDSIPGLELSTVVSYQLCCMSRSEMGDEGLVCNNGESITVDHVIECFLRRDRSSSDHSRAFILVYASPASFSGARCYLSWWTAKNKS